MIRGTTPSASASRRGTIPRRLLVAASLFFALLTIAEPASAAADRIGRCSARGDYATCVADGTASNPSRIWVTVKARPAQRIDAYWNVVCSRGSGAGTRDGRFAGVAPIKRAIRLPYSSPDDCTVAASAQLSGRGDRIVVILLAR